MGLEESSRRRPFSCQPEEMFGDEYDDEQSPEKKRRLSSEQVPDSPWINDVYLALFVIHRIWCLLLLAIFFAKNWCIYTYTYIVFERRSSFEGLYAREDLRGRE